MTHVVVQTVHVMTCGSTNSALDDTCGSTNSTRDDTCGSGNSTRGNTSSTHYNTRLHTAGRLVQRNDNRNKLRNVATPVVHAHTY